MKNEVFVQAMNEIDDDLIAFAYTYRRSKKRTYYKVLASLAACLTIALGGTLFFHHNHGINILFNGYTMKNQPVPIDAGVALLYDVGKAISQDIIVPLEIQGKSKVTMSVDEGIVFVYSKETHQLMYKGQNVSATAPILIQWRVEEPNQNKTYILNFNDRSIRLVLAYEESQGNWTIQKQEIGGLLK